MGSCFDRIMVGPVFISYSRKDDPIMQRVVKSLRKQGIKVWVDNEKLIPGTPIWEEEIEKAIISAGAIVVLLSPDSKKSPWVRREVTLADQHSTRIFPVLVRGDPGSSITIRLITRQYVDIRQNEELGLNSLSTAISSYLQILEAREQRAIEAAEKLSREMTAAKDEVEQRRFEKNQDKKILQTEAPLSQPKKPISFPEEIKPTKPSSLPEEIKPRRKPEDLPK